MTSLTKRSADSAVGHLPVALPRVNLLPPEVLAQARLRGLQRGLGAVVVGAVVVVGLLFHQAQGSVSDAQTKVDAASAEQAGVRRDAARYADVTAVYARRAAVQKMLVLAMGQEVRYSGLVDKLAATIPPNVWVTNVTWSQALPSGAEPVAAAGAIGTVSFTGVAFAHDDVAAWLDALASVKGYAVPYLQSSVGALIDSKFTVNWTAGVVMTADALSGRYLDAEG